MANNKNLKPIKKGELSSAEAKRRGAIGGIKSGQVRKEKKLLSQNFAEFLARDHDVTISGKKEKISGQKLINSVVSNILSEGGRSSVEMLRLIWEATESPPKKKFDVNQYMRKS